MDNNINLRDLFFPRAEQITMEQVFNVPDKMKSLFGVGDTNIQAIKEMIPTPPPTPEKLAGVHKPPTLMDRIKDIGRFITGGQKLSAQNTSAAHEDPIYNNKMKRALFMAESSGGTNRTNEFKDAGKFGWHVGFTKGTLADIQNKAANGDQRYIDLLKKIDLDTPKGAMNSAIEYMKFKNTSWNEKGKAIGNKFDDPVDIYTHIYNASGPEERIKARANFIKHYESQL